MSLVLVALAALTSAGCQREGSRPPAPPSGSPSTPVLDTLPSFVLTNEQQQSVSLDDLRGHIWVAGFMFTQCGAPCDAVAREMSSLAGELRGSPEKAAVRLVSFSVVPEIDTPQRLREFSASGNVDPSRWTFLTGTRAAMRALFRNGFRRPLKEPDTAGTPLTDPGDLILVDSLGQVRGTFGTDQPGGDALREALAAVLAESQPTAVVVPPDAADPKWTELRRSTQETAAAALNARHDFRFVDGVGTTGLTFRQGASVDLGKYYRATHYDHGTAVAAADVDGDGLVDLYFVNQVGRNALFRNVGQGHFEDVTDAAGVGVGDRACVGAAFADIDNDGDEDLFVTAVREGNLLFRNDGHGVFTDVTREAGVGGTGGHSSGAAFFDYDGDGRLDLFVTNVGKYTRDARRPDGRWISFPDAFAGHLHPERSEASILYRNIDGRRFEVTSPLSGLVHSAWSGDVTPIDVDADGRPDLYVPSMQGHDQLWYNLGGGRFENRGRRIFPATPWGAMGVKVLDWNGDAQLDLFVTDMHTDMSSDLTPDAEARKHDPKTMFPLAFLGTDGNHVLGNALFTGERDGTFTDRSDAAGVETGWPWGPSVGDLNADGWPDLFVGAGMNYPFRYHGSDLLLNDAGLRFVPAEFTLGVEPRPRRIVPWFELECDGADIKHDICSGEQGPVMNEDHRSPAQRGKGEARHGHVTVWTARAARSALLLDVDGDGDLDIVTNTYGDIPQVLVSDLAQRGPVHTLQVRLQGRRSNRDGLGAVVTVRAGGRDQVQVHDGKSGYLAQSIVPLYFGLGEASEAERITVRWPSGQQQQVRGPLRPGAPITIREP
ncbi:MAG: VCBS repeat-containing protein [Acidobacteria bacterium]|nr:VCBS repeat-containing protein [Acidobacteriota bacterium]